jgi:hypothetical protein
VDSHIELIGTDVGGASLQAVRQLAHRLRVIAGGGLSHFYQGIPVIFTKSDQDAG